MLRCFSIPFIVLLILSFIPSKVFAQNAPDRNKRFISLKPVLHQGNFDGTFYDGKQLRLNPSKTHPENTILVLTITGRGPRR